MQGTLWLEQPWALAWPAVPGETLAELGEPRSGYAPGEFLLWQSLVAAGLSHGHLSLPRAWTTSVPPNPHLTSLPTQLS